MPSPNQAYTMAPLCWLYYRHLRLWTASHSLVWREIPIKGYQAAKPTDEALEWLYLTPLCCTPCSCPPSPPGYWFVSLSLSTGHHDSGTGCFLANAFGPSAPHVCGPTGGLFSSTLRLPFAPCLLRQFPASQLLLCKYCLLQATFPRIYCDLPRPQLNWRTGRSSHSSHVFVHTIPFTWNAFSVSATY